MGSREVKSNTLREKKIKNERQAPAELLGGWGGGRISDEAEAESSPMTEEGKKMERRGSESGMKQERETETKRHWQQD